MTVTRTYAAAVGFLVAANLVGNLWLTPALYMPANLVAAAFLLWLAKWGGASPADLGLRRDRVPAGLRLGATVAAVIVAGLVLGAVIPAFRSFYEDQRAAEMSLGLLLYHAVVRIPLGTAVLEEVAFRGVLYGLGTRLWSRPTAALLSAFLFGLWHIAPLTSVVDANAAVSDVAPWLAIVGGVAAASLVGLFFTWVRERADSLVAPIVVHAGTNSVALVLAYLVV